MNPPQKATVLVTWTVLVGVTAYVPYYIPSDGIYRYSWIWQPVVYRDALHRSLDERLDLEELSEKLGIPVTVASERARPALGLFACELLLVLTAGTLAFRRFSRRSFPAPNRRSGKREAKAQWLQSGLTAVSLLAFTLGYYTRAEGLTQVRQVRLGVPFHWLIYTRAELRGPPPPDTEAFPPGLSIKWVELVMAILLVVGLTACLRLIFGQDASDRETLKSRRKWLLLVFGCAMVVGFNSPMEPGWMPLVMVVVGILGPVVAATWFTGQYQIAVLSSVVSVLTFSWATRILALFWTDMYWDVSVRQDVVPPLIFVLILAMVSALPMAYWRLLRRGRRLR